MSGPGGGNSTSAPPPYVYLNMRTSVVGSVAVEVLENGSPVNGCELENADVVKGNSVSARVTWSAAQTGADQCNLAALAAKGAKVSFRVAMVDAELFSIRLGCAA